MKIGLTLGKYAPFHKGHQFVIESALKEVDHLVVIIYDTHVTPIPLTVRAQWIRQIYPQVEVIEAWDGPEGYGTERAYEIKEELYVRSLIGDRQITHFYSSEAYGEHMSRSLEAKDCRIDLNRLNHPISGTMIRENPYLYKDFVHPIVYRDLIIKVVFLGAMSTGKSTLTEALAKKYQTTFASEYGRDYWTEHQVDRRISFEAFDAIGLGHIEREEIAYQNANQYCFVDTNAITTSMFALDYHGKVPELLTRLALENASRYDLFFVCDDDIPYDDTWDRSGDQKRKVFHKQILSDLNIRRIPYVMLQGDLETRIKKVEALLKDFVPYSNYFGKMS